MADKTVVVTKTVQFKVSTQANLNKREAFCATIAEWNKAVTFYADLFLSHPKSFEWTQSYVIKKGPQAGAIKERPVGAQELLTWAEAHTVATKAHPEPLRNFAAVCPQAPVVFRRAAINAASGAVKAHLTHCKNWEALDPKTRGKSPSLPCPHPHLVAYAGLSTVRLEDFRNGFLRLNLWDGQSWTWHNIPVEGPGYAAELFAGSEQEKERVRQERVDQNRRLQAERRENRTDEEKELLRPSIGVWVAESPTLIPRDGDWWIHVPFKKRGAIKGKAEERRLAEPDLKVGTFDLNAASVAGAAWAGTKTIDIKTLWHAQENAKREKVLQKVARKQRASGKPIKGEHSNRSIWGYVKNLDNSLAWQIASAIVTWAILLGLQVLVFEYLRPYRPQRGLSWSRRTNRKRSYWLRGKVVKYVRELALREGILVVERNPAWTSQMCPHCDHLAERFSPGGVGYPSRLTCEHCGWTGDANVAAALNLQRKWDRTFRYPKKAERKAKAEQRRTRKGGALRGLTPEPWTPLRPDDFRWPRNGSAVPERGNSEALSPCGGAGTGAMRVEQGLGPEA